MRSVFLRYWRSARTRICVRALTWPVLALAVVLIWLSLVGLPNFARQAIQRGLETAGVPLVFEKARFDIVNGLTLKQVSWSATPELGIETSVGFSRVVVGISHRDLLRGSFMPNALRLEDGVGSVAAGKKRIQAPRLTGELRRRGARNWTLSTLVARIGAFELKVDGAARLSEDFIALMARKDASVSWDSESWSRILEWLELINSWESEEVVRLAVTFGVDEGADVPGAIAATLRAPAIRGALWSVDDLRMSAAAEVGDSGGLGRVTVQGKAYGFRVGAVESAAVSISGKMSRFSHSNFAPGHAEWRLSGSRLDVGESILRSFDLEILGSVISPAPEWRSWLEGDVQGSVSVEVASALSPQGMCDRIVISGELPSNGENSPLVELNVSQVEFGALRGSLIDIALDAKTNGARPGSVADFLSHPPHWTASAVGKELEILELPLRTLTLDSNWRAGGKWISRIQAVVDGAEQVDVVATLDPGADRLDFAGTSGVRLKDWRRATPEGWLEGLKPFEFDEAPSVSFEVAALGLSELMSDGATDDWLRERLTVEAKLKTTGGAYREVPFESAEGALNVVDGELRITDIEVQRPEGVVSLDYIQPLNSAAYRIEVEGSAYAHGIKPLLGSETQRVFDHFETSHPVQVSGEILGPWDAGQGNVNLRLVGSDWVIRGEPASRLRANLEYIDKNSVVIVSDVEMELDSGVANLRRGKVDLENETVQLDGWVSRVDPDSIGRAIDADSFAFLDALRWYEPPEIRVDGTLGIGELETRNLVVEVNGGRSMIGPFFTDRFQAQFDWTGSLLSLSSFQGNGYGGDYSGKALFDLSDDDKTGLSFSIKGSSLDAHRLILDSLKDGSITGKLSGSLHVDATELTDLSTWTGNGNVTLEGGALIDEPVFGIVSTLLNRVVPGLGNTRASRLEGRFEIANKEVVASDLEISGAQFGVTYSGTVDFEGNVAATAEAYLFDEGALLGKIGNLMLKPVARTLRFQINGPIDQPEVELVYLAPRLLSAPLRPIDTIEKALQFELPF